jgi:hypothetical protein
MTFVSSSIPNLINGISQQPSAYRLVSQANEQINGVSSAIKGLYKRPPTQHIANLTWFTGDIENSLIEVLDYGSDGYFMLSLNDSISIANGAGTEVVLTSIMDGAYDPLDYLSGITNPKEELITTTIGDHTYIINRNKVVAKSTDLTPTRPQEGLVFIKHGDYSTEYKITITVAGTPYVVTYTTRDSSHVDHEPDIATKSIAEEIVGSSTMALVLTGTAPVVASYTNDGVGRGLLKTGFLPSGLTIDLKDNYIHITSTVDFTLDASDDRGDSHIIGVKGQINDFKRLPNNGPLGFKVKVIGDNEKNQDDYYVQLEDPDGHGDPVWKETTGDGIEYKLDPHTMPHVLIKNPDGTFVFQVREWDERKVGDEDTNPFPSFVGQPLNDLFFYRNRMGFLSLENVILSEVGEFWNFFHASTLILSDAAPIDVAVSTNKRNNLKYAVPFADELMLFSDSTQFTLTSGQVLAHDTVSINVSTNFEADLKCKPESVATFVFFATTRGEYGGVREYFVSDNSSDTKDADDITSHIPSYIKGSIRELSASSTEDMLVALSTEERSKVQVYNYFWDGTDKKQSAWHTWDMGADVLKAAWINSDLWLVMNRDGQPTLELMRFQADAEAPNMAYGEGLLLDRRFKLDATDYIVPYTSSSLVFYDSTGKYIGDDLTVDDLGSHFYVNPDGVLYAGEPYTFLYQFSEFLYRVENRPTNTDALKLKDIDIKYDKSATFSVSVKPNEDKGLATRDTYVNTLNPLISSSSNLLNNISIESGDFKTGIWGRAEDVLIEIVNATPYPSKFQSAEWRATVNKHAR